MKKIAVFLGDFFWSSVPYDGLDVHDRLMWTVDRDVDLLMFSKDIRLNKTFSGHEQFWFDTEKFKSNTNLKTIKDWGAFCRATGDYDLILTSTHIAPKERYPHGLKKLSKCNIACWDIGGGDILTNGVHFSTHFFVKGPVWKDWLINLGKEEKDVFVTGSPHYDGYGATMTKESFFEKYGVQPSQRIILVCPSNPGSHKEQFKQNIEVLRKIIDDAPNHNVRVLVKTYPHDYVFHEHQGQYTGVYKRFYTNKPQYELIKEMFPSVTIVHSQDHHSAIKWCSALFNMSGSHVSWETLFSQAKSYSMNYENKPYFGGVNYLKGVQYPDSRYNFDMKQHSDIFQFSSDLEPKTHEEFITKTHAASNIAQCVRKMLDVKNHI